jgi:hypothetical protein
MAYFNRFVYRRQGEHGESPQSPFACGLTDASHNAARLFLAIAAVLIALAILILLFPLILAVFVAVLFFIGAFICLRFALTCYLAARRTRRRHDPAATHIDVEVIDPD